MVEKKAVALVGGPVDGYEVYGPFETQAEAVDWCETEVQHESYWVLELQPPDDGEYVAMASAIAQTKAPHHEPEW